MLKGGQTMKSFLLSSSVVFAVAAWPTAAAAQSGWFWQNPRPTGNEIGAVATPAPGIVIAVGGFGTVLRSTDAGATWTVQPAVPANNSLAAVSFVNRCIGWAVGSTLDTNEALVMHTADGGATWTTQFTGLPGAFLAGVSFVDDNTGWAVGVSDSLDFP